MSVRAEALAVEALIDWLRLKLLAKVIEVNATRKPSVKSYPGPFEITAGMTLHLSASGAALTDVTLTTGAARTASELATELTGAVSGITPTADSADSDGRLILTTTAAASVATRTVTVGEDSTGANAIFGWDAGGEHVTMAPIRAPVFRNVMDGWPQQLDSVGGFLVIVGRRKGRPVPNIRYDETVVTLELGIFRPATSQENHRSREHISACLQCVREVLLTDAGRQLGRASSGDIMLVELGDAVVEGMRFQPFKQGKMFGPAFDSASLQLFVKVYERPAAS